MLQHEPQITEQTPSPDQHRVTPEELAKALAAVEARKEQSARETEGTIPIGEAVRQLGFDVTPDEVWAEVQAQRTQGRRGSRPRRRFRMMGLIMLPVVVGVGLVLARLPASKSDIPKPALPAALTASADLTVLDGIGPKRHLETLAEVPEDHPVQATMCSCGVEFGEYDSQENTWTLIKHSGRLYVRGWTLPMTEAVMRSRASIKVVNDKGLKTFGPEVGPEGLPDVRVTLALDSFKRVPNPNPNADSDPMEGDYFEATDIHLDKHAWEK